MGYIFGDFLKSKRLEKNLTLQAIGDLSGYKNRQNFWNAENRQNYANKESLSRFAEILDVDLKELICRKHLDRLQREVTDISDEKLLKCLRILLD